MQSETIFGNSNVYSVSMWHWTIIRSRNKQKRKIKTTKRLILPRSTFFVEASFALESFLMRGVIDPLEKLAIFSSIRSSKERFHLFIRVLRSFGKTHFVLGFCFCIEESRLQRTSCSWSCPREEMIGPRRTPAVKAAQTRANSAVLQSHVLYDVWKNPSSLAILESTSRVCSVLVRDRH